MYHQGVTNDSFLWKFLVRLPCYHSSPTQQEVKEISILVTKIPSVLKTKGGWQAPRFPHLQRPEGKFKNQGTGSPRPLFLCHNHKQSSESDCSTVLGLREMDNHRKSSHQPPMAPSCEYNTNLVVCSLWSVGSFVTAALPSTSYLVGFTLCFPFLQVGKRKLRDEIIDSSSYIC